MSLTGNEDHSISLSTAAAMTKKYRDTISQGDTIAQCFGKSAIQGILNQQGCVGIRFYYALDTNDDPKLVAVGVDGDGNDLYTGLLADRSYGCPDFCSSSNPLNTTVTTLG